MRRCQAARSLGSTTDSAVWFDEGDGISYISIGPSSNIVVYNAFGQVAGTSIFARIVDPVSFNLGSTYAVTLNYYDRRGQQVATVDAAGYVTTTTP